MIITRVEGEEIPVFGNEDEFPRPSESYPERGFILFLDMIPVFGITYGKTKELIEQLQKFIDECNVGEVTK